MKPNFALSLSFDGIRLLKRAPEGWALIGDVALDVEDLHGALYVMRQTAEDHAPEGVWSKLVIPNAQVRYLTVATGDVDEAARWVAARAALDGATPYAVDDLAFDLASDGDKTHVAAVAIETLREAETFAAGHGFNPVSFVATPEGDAFPGEAFFGESTLVRAEFGPGTQVERDPARIVEVGPAVLETPGAFDETFTAGMSDDAVDEHFDAETPTADVAAPEAQEVPDAAVAEPAVSGLPFKHRPYGEDMPGFAEEPAALSPSQQDLGDDDGDDGDGDDVSDQVQPAFARGGFRVQNMRDAYAKGDPDDAPADGPMRNDAPGFSSRRTAARTEPTLGGVTRKIVRPAPVLAPNSVAAPDLPDDGDAPHTVPVAEPEAEAHFAAASLTPTSPAQGRLEGLAAQPARSSAAQAIVSDEEAERLTIFGARGMATGRVSPARLGLMATAVVVVLVAGVAAWATVFSDDRLAGLFPSRATPEPELAQAPTASDPITPPASVAERADPSPAAPVSLSAPATDVAPDVDVAALNTGLTDEDAAVLEALRERPDPIEQDDFAKPALDPGLTVWFDAPLSPKPVALLGLDDLYEPGIDRSGHIRESHDALALPTLASLQTDDLILSPSPPAAAGTAFRLDPRGLVIPTPEGALNPDGVRVYAGLPPVVPETYPDRTSRAEPVAIDPAIAALADARPRLRPDSLIEDTERANLGGLSRSELAGFRPVLRPAIARTPEEEQAEEPDAPATAQAVRVSLRPDTRPNNFSRVVARAQPAPKKVAAVAPRTVTPKIPSSTSASREATVKNAINLSRINLIGVYGTPSQRRALVRLSNGRYQKVKVGDRLDGGQVSAIGDSELRYQKRGRNVVLKMPRS